MSRRLPFLAMAALLGLSAAAQEVPDTLNLVPNGDFEQIEGKLRRLGGIEAAKGWESPTGANADLYSETVGSASPLFVPKNAHGFESGLSGQNYAGILCYSYLDKEPRSYLQVKFKKMLKKGQKYCIKYYVSLSDLSKYACDHLGAYIAPTIIRKKEDASLTYAPQVPSLMTKVYKTMDGWEGVCGVYEAKGDEQYLVIGNFAATEKTTTEKVRRQRGESRVQQANAYYFVDNVSVTPIKLMSECSCDADDKSESAFIFSRKSTKNPGLSPMDHLDQSEIYFLRFNHDIDASMKPLLDTLASVLKSNPTIKLKLTGHTDLKEADRVRMRPELTDLDVQRAQAVKDFFTAAGVEASRITVSGKKAEDPAVDAKDEVSMAQNRRVAIDVLK